MIEFLKHNGGIIANIIGYSVLFAWLIFSISFCLKALKEPNTVNKNFFSLIPGLFITLGIFGTFLGIAVALLNFNPDNSKEEFEKNLPQFLGGLQTAFLTSIIGIVLSLVFNFWTKIIQRTNEEFYLSRESQELIEIKKLIWNYSKQNSEELYKALSERINSFDEKFSALISSLVEKNFEELSKSIERLNEWQKQNEKNVSEIYRLISTIDKIDKSLSSISENTDRLVGEGGKLQILVNELQKAMITDQEFSKTMRKASETIEKMNTVSIEYDKTQKTINEWLKGESGIHQAMTKYTDGLKTFNDALIKHSISTETINNLSNQYKVDLNTALNGVFGRLDQVLASYIKHLEEKGNELTVKIQKN
jgi:ABC-type transporter Mla subunit MlaD